MSVATSRGLNKLGRTIIQWVVSLGTTGITVKLGEYFGVTFNPVVEVMFEGFWLFVYTYCQNFLETNGSIPVIFPVPPIPVISEVGTEI